VTICGIASKSGIRMCPYAAFHCTKFQGNWIMLLCLILSHLDEKKKRRKNEETQPIFEDSYLGNT